MALRRLPNVSCGLNIGQIYNLSYNYTPQEGVRISISFVKQDGNYPNLLLQPMTRTSIQIGTALFSMFPISYTIKKGPGSRFMTVEFVDDTFRLDNYYVALTGRGCGEGVFELGTPVDNRTLDQKLAGSLDDNAETVRNFTQFPDLQYTFAQFLAVLGSQFSINVNALYNTTFTKDFTGTFRTVLNDWCSFYNLSYYFENGTLKIFDPTRLTITLPTQPADAIEYDYSESVESTYSKTAFAYFEKEGGQFTVNDVTGGSLTTAVMYPVDSQIQIANLQQQMPMDQVVAAQYGKAFWFLYNYSRGTAAAECGWEEVPVPSVLVAPLAALRPDQTNGYVGPAKLAKIDSKLFDQKFQAYYEYGQKIAGRYYISDLRYNLTNDQQIQWFNSTDVSIVDYASDFAKGYQVSPQYISENKANSGDSATVDGTIINDTFAGIKYTDERMLWIDDKFNPSSLLPVQTENFKSTVEKIFNNLFSGLDGGQSLDVSSLGNQKYAPFFNIDLFIATNIYEDILLAFNAISDQVDLFKYRYTSLSFTGMNQVALTSIRAANAQGNTITIVNNTNNSVTGNTGIIRAINEGNRIVYYDKYSRCASASSGTNASNFRRLFSQVSVPYDIPVTFTYQNSGGNGYRINRDLTAVNNIVNSSLLQTVAQQRSFTTKRVTMTLNYFYSLPASFLTNGLVSMDLEIGEGGVNASYTFSNDVLQVPYQDREGNISQAFSDQLRASMPNSWIRTYNPSQVISVQ